MTQCSAVQWNSSGRTALSIDHGYCRTISFFSVLVWADRSAIDFEGSKNR